jgi:hypothetical protein
MILLIIKVLMKDIGIQEITKWSGLEIHLYGLSLHLLCG